MFWNDARGEWGVCVYVYLYISIDTGMYTYKWIYEKKKWIAICPRICLCFGVNSDIDAQTDIHRVYLESVFVWELNRVKPWLTVDQWTYMAMET